VEISGLSVGLTAQSTAICWQLPFTSALADAKWSAQMMQPRSRTVICKSAILLGLCLLTSAMPALAASPYPWLAANAPAQATLAGRIAPPPGFERVPVTSGSWGAWLRSLPMKPAGAPVMLFDGRQKPRQDVHVAVIDIDVGRRDLQQCADAVMRLRAEWLYAQRRHGDIAFDYTGGGRVPFSRFVKGERPSENGRNWSSGKATGDDYAAFKRYMQQVFAFAGTYSLARELQPVSRQIGDVFIKGGFPGHAVLVADMVRNASTGEQRFLLLQSYMPAQDIHVLKQPGGADGSPWYPGSFAGGLATPEWQFPEGSLKRWP
jgi:hypothetical protein